jgi:hypothetical protein
MKNPEPGKIKFEMNADIFQLVYFIGNYRIIPLKPFIYKILTNWFASKSHSEKKPDDFEEVLVTMSNPLFLSF